MRKREKKEDEEEEEAEGEEGGGGGGGGAGLPRGTVLRVARAAVPGVMLSGDVQTLLVACCDRFVGRLAAEAAQKCAQRKKAVLGPQDVLEACKGLGFHFEEGLAEVQEALVEKKKAGELRKSQQSDMTPEEKRRIQVRWQWNERVRLLNKCRFSCRQEEMFEQAARDMLNQ